MEQDWGPFNAVKSLNKTNVTYFWRQDVFLSVPIFINNTLLSHLLKFLIVKLVEQLNYLYIFLIDFCFGLLSKIGFSNRAAIMVLQEHKKQKQNKKT